MRHRRLQKMSGGQKLLLASLAMLAAATGVLTAPTMRAQSPPPAATPRPKFEVASIKPQTGYPNGYHHPVFVNGRFTATAPLMQLIAFAYHVPLNPSRRLSGGPDWIRGPEGFYDIHRQSAGRAGAKGSLRAILSLCRCHRCGSGFCRFSWTQAGRKKGRPVAAGGPRTEKASLLA